MRRFLILALAVLMVFGLMVFSVGTALARSGPFLPGDTLFSLQFLAEQQHVRWPATPQAHAEQLLNLYERRLGDLVIRTGSPHEVAALVYLEQALSQAVSSLADLPPGASQAIGDRLRALLGLSQVALNGLTVAPIEELY